MEKKQIASGAVGALILAGALFGGSGGLSAQSPYAARPFTCSSATLNGSYAVIGGGFVPSGPPPAPLAPFANVSMMTLDGKGVFSDKISFNDNGQPVRRTQSGIYQVNEDCTGQLAVTLPTPPFQLDFDIVVSGFVQGTGHAGEFYAIGVTPGGVVTFTARRIR